MFENPEISLDDLPAVAAIEWRSLDRKLVWSKLVGGAIALAFVCLGVGFGTTVATFAVRENGIDMSFAILWLIPLLVAIPTLTWPFISVPRMGYAVRDKDIVFKSGVLWHTVTAIPFNRIQHVEKDSTPLDRRLELANLKIFTAGGAGGDLKIHGLSADIAERLRVLILDKVGAVLERH